MTRIYCTICTYTENLPDEYAELVDFCKKCGSSEIKKTPVGSRCTHC